VEDRHRADREAVNAVEEQRVEVRACVERGVEALNDGNHAGLERATKAGPARAAAQPRRDGGDELAQHEGGERGMPTTPRGSKPNAMTSRFISPAILSDTYAAV
jgi:hypothetical protein